MIYYIFNDRMYELVDAMEGQALIRNIITEQQAWVDHRLLKGCKSILTQDALGSERESSKVPVG